MNEIEKAVYGMLDINRQLGLFGDEQKKIIEGLKEQAIAKAYEKGNVQLLVNQIYIDENGLDIGDYTWGEDYEILTSTLSDSEGNEFYSKEEAQEFYVEEFKNKCINKKGRMVFDQSYEPVIFIEDNEDDVDDKLFNEKVNDWVRMEGLDRDSITIEEGYYVIFPDHEDEFESGEYDTDYFHRAEWEAENYLEEEAESYAEDKVDELEEEYDEIYVNWVRNYYGEVDIDIAQECGLGVLRMNNSEQEYMFLQGCGMDFSPKFVQYLALAHRGTTKEYISKFTNGECQDWVACVLNNEAYYKVLEKLGVDVERLKTRNYTVPPMKFNSCGHWIDGSKED